MREIQPRVAAKAWLKQPSRPLAVSSCFRTRDAWLNGWLWPAHLANIDLVDICSLAARNTLRGSGGYSVTPA
jgi:hypothetical protein